MSDILIKIILNKDSFTPFFVYLALINAVSFAICAYDKKVSKIKGHSRVPEKTLILLCVFFGSAGILLGMNIFRHKTKHKKFTVGIPCIVILHIIMLFLYINFM